MPKVEKDLGAELVRRTRASPSLDRIESALSILPERYRMVVTRSFGYGVAETTVSELAKETGISYGRTLAIRNTGLAKMRRHLHELEKTSDRTNPN